MFKILIELKVEKKIMMELHMFIFSKSYRYTFIFCNYGLCTYVLEGAMVLLVDLLPSGGVLPHHKTVIIFANCTNTGPVEPGGQVDP